MKYCKDCVGFDECNTTGRTVEFAVDDGVCIDFDERKPQTNADRIRAMSDEELALNIGNGFFGCPQCSQGDCRKCDLECEKHCLEWLQSTAEEADHA